MFIYASSFQHYLYFHIHINQYWNSATDYAWVNESLNDRTIQLILQGLFPFQLPSFNCSICLNGTQLDVVKLHHLK